MTAPPDEFPGDGEFVPREEYERRHKILRRRYEAFAARTLRILKVLVVVMILNGAFSAYLLDQNSTRVDENSSQNLARVGENKALVTSLQAAIVESCEQIGNERAKVSREQLNEEIFDAEHPDPEVVAAFDLPPEKIDELIAENVATLRARLARIKLTDCATQYKISPGSGDRRRDKAAGR